jgi:hypothetical protein
MSIREEKALALEHGQYIEGDMEARQKHPNRIKEVCPGFVSGAVRILEEME